MIQPLPAAIDGLYDNIDELRRDGVGDEARVLINKVIAGLNSGEIRSAEYIDGQWQACVWVKKAILLSFVASPNTVMDAGPFRYYDKIAQKFADYDADRFAHEGMRAVPGAIVRQGAFIDRNVVLMPSFVNIGAYVGAGTLVDTWATVGSCAQIGRNVHLSGGAGIGGVLEPLQGSPTIIEDDCFIGARSEIVEGVVVGKGSVISMGVFIGQSTRIYERETGKIYFSHVPPGSVVVPGSLPAKDGSHNLYCAVIVKKVDEKTKAKTDLNDFLRNLEN